MLDLGETGPSTEGGFTDSFEVKLSYARHESVGETEGIAPLIPKLVARWEVWPTSLPGCFTHRTH